MYERHSKVALNSGMVGWILEVFDNGEAYLFEREDAPELDDDEEAQFVVTSADIRGEA